MNERIEGLWWQARIGSVNNHQNPEVLEKFAQLIVGECAKVIFETPVEYMETDTMHRIRDRVKQHFGVNE